MSDNEPLLTAQQLAEYLSVTTAMLANWRYLGHGPKFIKIGHGVRYRSSDVENWLADNTRTQT